MWTHANPNKKDWEQLAVLFLSKSNGTTIFPKLPTQLRAHYNTWKSNNTIRLAHAVVKADFNELVLDLADLPERIAGSAPAVSANEVAGVVQNEADDDHVAVLNVDQEMNPHPVAPPAAVDQAVYVRVIAQEIRRTQCYYYPDCKAWSQVCGGIRNGLRHFVNSGQINIGDEQEFQGRKRKAKTYIKTAKTQARHKKRRRGM